MSSTSLKRIKEIRQKSTTSETGYIPIPIGTSGLLVDLASNFDLEEDLKLGSNHYVQIKQNGSYVQIIEYYFSAPRYADGVLRDVQAMFSAGLVTHKVDIIIDSGVNYLSSDGMSAFIQDEVNYNLITVGGEQSLADYDKIDMTLYKYSDGNQITLHHKVIFIQGNESGDYIIDEQVDNIENPFEGGGE